MFIKIDQYINMFEICLSHFRDAVRMFYAIFILNLGPTIVSVVDELLLVDAVYQTIV